MMSKSLSLWSLLSFRSLLSACMAFNLPITIQW